MTNGFELGYIEHQSEKIHVYLFDYIMTDPDLMNEDNIVKYNEMCHDINFIISKLIYDNGMVEVIN